MGVRWQSTIQAKLGRRTEQEVATFSTETYSHHCGSFLVFLVLNKVIVTQVILYLNL